MNTDTTNITPPVCPNPNLYEFTVRVRDRRRKTGWRVLESYTREFPDQAAATAHAVWLERRHENRAVEVRKYWVLKRNFMAPHIQYWEACDTPYCCSPAGELYWTM